MLAMPLILPLAVLIEIYLFVLWYSIVVFQDYCRMLLPADAATRRTEEDREMLLEGKNAVIYGAGGAIGSAVVD
jgi:hypothetical protein